MRGGGYICHFNHDSFLHCWGSERDMSKDQKTRHEEWWWQPKSGFCVYKLLGQDLFKILKKSIAKIIILHFFYYFLLIKLSFLFFLLLYISLFFSFLIWELSRQRLRAVKLKKSHHLVLLTLSRVQETSLE